LLHSSHCLFNPTNYGNFAPFTPLYSESCSGKHYRMHYYDHTFGYFQEYERAVIFRLGRLLSGGARGPGVFFVIPCVDVYEKIDMRTCTYEIPPQEVIVFKQRIFPLMYNIRS
jgi:hypothetical protein